MSVDSSRSPSAREGRAERGQRGSCRRRQCGVATILLLAGCAHSEAYRFVDRPEGQGLILQPNTRFVRHLDRVRTRRVVIDVLDVLLSHRRCRGYPWTTESLSAEPVYIWTRGARPKALRISAPATALESELSIATAVDQWWAGLNPRSKACFEENAAAAIKRALSSQRPMTSDQAIEQWFGPGTEPSAPRVVVLRAGMQVCAHEAVPDSSGTGLRLGPSDCARVVDTAAGPRFDPVAGRFAVPLTGQAWSTGQARRVTSWAEVQQPFPASSGGARPRFAYVITYPIELPTGPDAPGLDFRSLIVAVDLAATIAVPGRPHTALDAVRYYSGAGQMSNICSGQPAIVCIQFGERTTFSISFPVTVNRTVLDIPLGATLGTVGGMVAPDLAASDIVAPSLARHAGDPAALSRLRSTARRVRLWRWFEGRRVRVHLQSAEMLDFPLQPGDEIEW